MASVEHLRRAFVVARAAAILVLGCVVSVLLIGNANLAQDGGGGGGNGGPPEVVGTQNLTDDNGFEQIVADPDAMEESSGGGPGNAPGRVKIMLPGGPGNAPLVTLLGKQNHDRFGHSVSATMDFNYDGHVDVLVGAPEENQGHAYLFFGPFPGGNAVISAEVADWQFSSPISTGYRFGDAVAPITDFDDDGFPDIRIRQYFVNSTGDEDEVTFVFSSLDHALIAYFIGEHSAAMWQTVAGDLDHDGDVDEIDLLLMAERQGITDASLSELDGDLNGDGVIDGADMADQLSTLGADLFDPMVTAQAGGGGDGGEGVVEPSCGDGVCDSRLGETDWSCPEDCQIVIDDCPPLQPAPGDEPGYNCIGDVICLTMPLGDNCAGTPQISGPAKVVLSPESTCADQDQRSDPVLPGQQFYVVFCGSGQVTITYSPVTTDPNCDCVNGPPPLLYNVVAVDLDVDSDNTVGMVPPERDVHEDAIEDDDAFAGKLIPVNNGNADEDSVPDFADGFNLDGLVGTDDDHCDGSSFIPMIVEVNIPGVDPEDIVVTLTYADSDPSGMTVDGSRFEPAAGHLRLWTKNANESRQINSISDPANPGDFVPAGSHSLVAFSESSGVVFLYIEGIEVIDGESIPIGIEVLAEGVSLPPECTEDVAKIRLYDLEHLTFDDETLIVEPAPSVTGPSDLSPDLSVSIVDSRILPNGTIEVDIEGHVRDRLSELADNTAHRLQEVRFHVNGVFHSAITNLPAMSPGSGVLPWQPYILDVNFTTTLTIADGEIAIRPEGYIIDAITSTNAAGRTAKDSIQLSVQWQMLDDMFEVSLTGDAGLTLSFLTPPSNSISDWAWVYFGNRDPEPTDGDVWEPQAEPDSLQFVGELLPGDGIEIPCTIEIDGPLAWTVDEIDTFEAIVTYEFQNKWEYVTTGTWTETGVDSLRFIQTTPPTNAVQVGDDPGGGSYFVPVIAEMSDINIKPDGVNGFMERTLVRVVGLGDEIDPATLTGFVNDTMTPLDLFTYSPPYHYYVHEDQPGRPRIFVITIDPLPAGIDAVIPDNLLVSDDNLNELKLELWNNDHDFEKYIHIELFEDDFGIPPTVEEPAGTPVTLPVLLTYFQLIYGDTGLELFEMFQDGNGAIYLEDQLFQLNVDYWLASAPNSMEIEIEEDVNPVEAAQYLWAGLRKLLPYEPMIEQMDPGEDLDWWIEAYKQRGIEAAGIGVAAAHIYLAGIGIVNEGADWVLTINELTQGHWEASIGFLPFATASMASTGRVIVKGSNGVVLGTFPNQIAQAVAQARQLPHTIAARYPVLQQAGATRAQMRAFVRGGVIPTPKFRGQLKKRMLEQGPPPSTFHRPQLHHELSWVFRDRFTQWGFDVNDPQFGKWVEGGPIGNHQRWSYDWNRDWEGLLDQLDNNPGMDLATGRSIILQHLDQMRQGYGPGGPYPVP